MKIESLFQHRGYIGQIGDEIVRVRDYRLDLWQQRGVNLIFRAVAGKHQGFGH